QISQLATSLLPPRRSGDFAQALMDLGASLCSPKRPACALCPWSGQCRAHAAGNPETFPRKAPRRQGRLRRGAAFVVLRADGCVLVQQRPGRGLLAGMTEVPGSDWTHDFDAAAALRQAPPVRGARWRRLPGVVRHVFTHFPLELTVYVARVPRTTHAPRAPRAARWVPPTDLPREALPNVMRKVLARALGADPA